jgi:hypothetical protein
VGAHVRYQAGCRFWLLADNCAALWRRSGPLLHGWPCSAERAITLETGRADRVANMEAFAKRALELLGEAIAAAA